MKKLTKTDFIQIDSQWIYALGAFHLSIVPNKHGEFCLHVYGSIEPLPPATQYPTEPEWDKALNLANKFMEAYAVAVEKDELE